MARESPEACSKDTAGDLGSSSICECSSRPVACFAALGYLRARVMAMTGPEPKQEPRMPRRQTSNVEMDEASTGTPVTLHIYDTLDFAGADSSLPIVHLGVEIFEIEVCFGERGVRFARPGSYNQQKHRDPLLLGHTHLPKKKVYKILSRLKKAWPGERYRFVGCNCQTFAMELCEQLDMGACIPAHYTRFAKPFLSPISNIIPALVCQQLGSHSNSGSDGYCPSGSSRESSELPIILETLDDAGCSRASTLCSRTENPVRQNSGPIRRVSSVSGFSGVSGASGASSRSNRSKKISFARDVVFEPMTRRTL